jgi:hypothetical protein
LKGRGDFEPLISRETAADRLILDCLGDVPRGALKAGRSFSTLSLPGLSMITVYAQRRGLTQEALQ